VNLHHEFLDGTEVAVSGVSLFNEQDQWSGEIGLGSSWNWGDDKYSLYGKASVSTDLENFADSYSFNGTIGIRARF
ncbi:MAG: autotransporter outer membrane beta-barrel domain-containing protein, partial [bacterium]|nr:autotransporter outer membrane beta-barrel domain-containing protein [bacterium]